MIRLCPAIVVAACLTGSISSAQERTSTVALLPPSAPRWDISGHVTWLGERRPNDLVRWNQWFNLASGGGIVGYYWTSHFKTEFDLSTSSQDETYSFEPIALPGSPTISPLQRDHDFRITTASAGAIGQFFENAWFHPFLGAGLEVVREREHIETSLPIGLTRNPRTPFVPDDFQPETRERYSARPYLTTGSRPTCQSARSSEPTYEHRGLPTVSLHSRGAAASASTSKKGCRQCVRRFMS